ncbi:MAG: glycosyltransferase family 4 protein, partial [Chloroflexi bacterium]|nr:glycosyltransferase family 4 protein [Chloroflexota bacterium]
MLIGIDASRAARAQRTGTENYALRVVQHLLTLDAAHHYRLYLQQPPPAGLFPSRAELRVVKPPRLWTHLGLSLEMLRHAPDVLFVPAHVLPIVHPHRSVVTIHDLGYRYFPNAHTRAQRAYLDWSTRFAVRHASRLIAVSHATKDDLVKLYGADERRIAVVHHGTDDGRWTTDDDCFQQFRTRFKLPERYVISVGTLQPRKNYARLIEAFASLQCADTALVIVGKVGWNAKRVMEQAKRAGVIVTGHIDDDEKFALLQHATAFALPSLYEGFGMPILEAQAAGVPVITSNTSSCPEVAGDGALLVNPLDTCAIADALRRVLNDEPLRRSLIARGRANAAKFSWEQCARQTLQVVENT